MTNEQTISWIFLATALASQTGPTDLRSISSIADGINHAVPTQKELQISMKWLTNKGLVTMNGNKYSLTTKGKSEYDEASRKTSTLFAIWENLEKSLIATY